MNIPLVCQSLEFINERVGRMPSLASENAAPGMLEVPPPQFSGNGSRDNPIIAQNLQGCDILFVRMRLLLLA